MKQDEYLINLVYAVSVRIWGTDNNINVYGNNGYYAVMVNGVKYTPLYPISELLAFVNGAQAALNWKK